MWPGRDSFTFGDWLDERRALEKWVLATHFELGQHNRREERLVDLDGADVVIQIECLTNPQSRKLFVFCYRHVTLGKIEILAFGPRASLNFSLPWFIIGLTQDLHGIAGSAY